MVQKVDKIWMNGKLVSWDEAQVHILTLTLHYGLGVFEGIRLYQGKDGKPAIFRNHEHIKRLFDSAKMLLMEIPFTPEALIAAEHDVIKVNKMTAGYLRPIAYVAEGEVGLAAQNPVRVAVIAFPWGAYLGEEGIKNGIRAKVSSY